jgi:hypothetical protein
MPRTLLYAALSAAALIATAFGQEYRSTLTGQVTDPTGAAVPHANITVTKTDTNTEFKTVTSAEGFYTAPFLLPGPYKVTVTAAGFETFTRSGIELGSNTRVAVDVKLTLGVSTQSIQVTADAPALESVTASAGQVITTHEVESLPINGRAPMDLAIMGYGVVNTGTRDQNRPFENSGFSAFAMGGAPAGANAAFLDGVPNVGTVGTTGTRIAFSPLVDAVEDVKVEVFNVDASMGGFGGGTVEITTKSGTNQIHGALSEYNENNRLTATPFFTNASGGRKTVFRSNQWGFGAGGPIYIPKVFDGRNMAFFFFAYEGYKSSTPAPAQYTVATGAEKSGDFSALLKLNTKSKDYTLYDPSTAVLSNGIITRQAFPNNIIPQNRINPIASKFLTTWMPEPNKPGVYDDTNNYYSDGGTIVPYHSFNGRGDFNLSNRNKISFIGRTSLYLSEGGDVVPNLAYLQHTGGRELWSGSIDDVHTFSPTFIGDLRVGMNRYWQFQIQGSAGYDPTQLGFPSYMTTNSSHLMMPLFSFPDYAGNYGNNSSYYTSQPYTTSQLYNSYTKMWGQHAIKFGGQVLLQEYANISWLNSTGLFTFDAGTWVKQASNLSNPTLGGSIAEFLLGLPTSGEYDLYQPPKNTSFYDVLFLNDDWHVKPNLTINAGLRWEYDGPTVESHNRQAVAFNATAVNQVTAPAQAAYAASPLPQLPPSAFQPVGGLVFASPGNRAAYSTSHKQFAPRLGLSWSPTALHGKTVVRAGAGIFYFNYGVQSSQQPSFSQVTTYNPTSNSYLTPANTLNNPFPTGIVQPTAGSLGVNTYLGQSITFYNPQLANEYSLRWTFDIQQQLPANTVLEIGYVGNHAVHLTTNYNFGSLPASYLSRLPVRDAATINALSAVTANPFQGLLPNGGSLNGSTTSVSNLLKPFPEFSGVTEALMNNGGSYYSGLDMKLQKRLSQGLQLSFTYSFSRLMDHINYLNGGSLALEKRVSSDDRPASMALAAVYDLPWGKGQRFMQHANPAVNAVLGNWALSTVYTYHSGAPLGWGNVIYNGGDLNYDASNVSHAFNTSVFNTVSSQQLASNFRYFPSQFNTMRIEATNNINITVTKNFLIRERIKLQFRAEAFNFCNHPLFGGPNTSPTSSAFATITSQSNSPRTIEFGLRLTF